MVGLGRVVIVVVTRQEASSISFDRSFGFSAFSLTLQFNAAKLSMAKTDYQAFASLQRPPGHLIPSSAIDFLQPFWIDHLNLIGRGIISTFIGL